MRYLDLTLPDPAANLALDEALLLDAETGGEVLRLWEWPAPVVVLGSGCKLGEDVNEPACVADGVPILRRSSGGGTVLWGRGSLQFSLVLSYERSPELTQIRSSYRYILGRVAAALGLDGVQQEGISDLALGGRKFSGNAQQRKSRFLLHHGTLLYDFDLAAVGRYLRQPPRQPEYREQRRHEDFLCNLPLPAQPLPPAPSPARGGEEKLSAPPPLAGEGAGGRGWSAAALKQRLCAAWAGEERTTWPEEMVRVLCAEKYARAEWTRRR